MSKIADPEAFLFNISRKLESGDLLSVEDLKTIITICGSSHSQVRESALTLLLQPPIRNDVEHYRWIISTILASTFPIKKLPLPLIELICEIISFLEKVPEGHSLRGALVRFLKHLPAPAMKALSKRRYPLSPFLLHLPAKTVAVFGKNPSPDWKLLWRHFRCKVLKGATEPSWAHLTFSDMNALWVGPHPSRWRYHLSKARWRRIMRQLLAPAATNSALCLNPVDLMKSWRHGPESPTHLEPGWENLIDLQSQELEAVRNLAFSVSKVTRRVVLSWHNATLAAAGGWAFETIGQQLPSRRNLENLQRSITLQAKAFKQAEHSWNELDHIWELWQKRLVEPKVLHALWESRIKMDFGFISQAEWDKDLSTSRNYLGTDTLSALTSNNVFSWHGAVSSHQRIKLEEIVAWRNFRHKIWLDGLINLVALIRESQSMLDRGLISHFVLPWIDKFFISSRREADVGYLAAIVKWLESWGIQPLILFWEDTGHAQNPSFQLALNRFRENGMEFRGIGVFDPTGSRREEAFDIICNEHKETRLFALRPCSDIHSPQLLPDILHNLRRSSISSYDSSWKDNLCFIYAGTQIQHLLSVQCEEERFAPWIKVGNVKYPFGMYLRERLRRKLLDQTSFVDLEDSFSHAYSIWANLC